jgi:hypothetical protein
MRIALGLCLTIALLAGNTAATPAKHKTPAHAPRHTDVTTARLASPRWGYIDRTGKVVITPTFESAGDFSEDLAPVKTDKWGYIDKTGRTVIKPQFAEVSEFSEGLAAVRIGKPHVGDCLYIDKTGRVALRSNRKFADSFHDGLALVADFSEHQPDQIDASGSCGYIDKSGKIVIKPEYEVAGHFSEGLAPVRIGLATGKWGYIGKDGEVEIDPVYSYARPFSDGLAWVRYYKEEEGWAYIDKLGKVVIRGKGTQADASTSVDFCEGLVAMWEGDRFSGGLAGYMDKTGKTVIKPQFCEAGPFSEGLALVCFEQDRSYGFINKAGDVVIRLPFGVAQARPFHDGLAAFAGYGEVLK